MMRIALDYTAALTQHAGIGRYVRELARALIPLLGSQEELVLWHGRVVAPVAREWPESAPVREVELPFSPTWVTRLWQRLRVPLPLERFTGSLTVSHGPDFVAPPSRAPCLVTVHDLSFIVVPQYAHPRLRVYLATAVPRSVRRASAVITVSEQVRREVVEYFGLPAERVIAIPHGVTSCLGPLREEEARDTLSRLGVHEPYFLMVGTIEPRKNHLGALEAFAMLASRYPEVSLVVVGRPGWLSEPIMRALHEAAARLPVRYLGPVTNRDLAALYSRSLALVYPSWYEGFGLPILEAMACGTCVITTGGGAPAEMAGDAALTITPGQPETLADAMERLIADAALRQRLAECGKRRAAAYSWDRTARLHLELYRQISEGAG